VVKLHRFSGKAPYLACPDFDTVPHPAILLRFFSYGGLIPVLPRPRPKCYDIDKSPASTITEGDRT
jgi:hypothetical protein